MRSSAVTAATLDERRSPARPRGASERVVRRRRRRLALKSERGAALVEMAIVLPLLMMLLMGIMTGGLAIDHKINLTNASREAARYGATVPQTQCTPITACNNLT